MVPTCKWTEQAFWHIVQAVFQMTSNSPLVQALEEAGITDICSLVTLRDQDIASLTYRCSKNHKDTPLATSDKYLLLILQSFHFHWLAQGHAGHELISVSQDEFEQFRNSSYCPHLPSTYSTTVPMENQATLYPDFRLPQCTRNSAPSVSQPEMPSVPPSDLMLKISSQGNGNDYADYDRSLQDGNIKCPKLSVPNLPTLKPSTCQLSLSLSVIPAVLDPTLVTDH